MEEAHKENDRKVRDSLFNDAMRHIENAIKLAIVSTITRYLETVEISLNGTHTNTIP